MKIEGGDPKEDLFSVKRKSPLTGSNDAKATVCFPATDSIEPTGSIPAYRHIKEAVLVAPDIRSAKVDALRESIVNGTYRIDAGFIADRIIDEFI